MCIQILWIVPCEQRDMAETWGARNWHTFGLVYSIESNPIYDKNAPLNHCGQDSLSRKLGITRWSYGNQVRSIPCTLHQNKFKIGQVPKYKK